jgi:hypothetical protein
VIYSSPFHFGFGPTAPDQHTGYAREPVRKQPQFKSSPETIRRKNLKESLCPRSIAALLCCPRSPRSRSVRGLASSPKGNRKAGQSVNAPRLNRENHHSNHDDHQMPRFINDA